MSLVVAIQCNSCERTESRAGMSVERAREALRGAGWVQRRRLLDTVDASSYVTEDFCPEHSGETLPGCVCVACGPPWRDILPKPEPGSDAMEGLAWHSWMSLCPRCGNKRCPGAVNHRNPCKEAA